MNIRIFTLLTIFALVVTTFSFNVTGHSVGSPLPADPRAEATVNMSFDGLMAICFGDPTRASIGILDVPHHTPSITITRVTNNKKTVVATLSGAELRGNLSIHLESAIKGAVNRYQAVDMNSDANDFRWTVDMEQDLFQRRLYIDEAKLFGKIHIDTGLFYAANLSDSNVRFVAADNSGKMLPFQRRIGEPAAKLNLSANDALIIKANNRNLRLTAEAGVRYEIAVGNLPREDMANMDHWLFYYDILTEKVTPYTVMEVQKAAYSPQPIICNAAIFSSTKLN